MNPFDSGNMGSFLGGFQQRMSDMKARAEATEVEGTAGGGKVKVRVTCNYECTGIDIDPSLTADVDILEDLIRAATNEALRRAREETKSAMGELASGLPIPPGLIPGL
jgi:DNA-binding YbaB/EbfC family protein